MARNCERGNVVSALLLGALAAAVASAPARADEPCVEKWEDALSGYDPLVASAVVSYDFGEGEKLYLAGLANPIGNIPTQVVVSYDGTDWQALGERFDADPTLLSVFDDGTGPALYAGGKFTACGDRPLLRIARWDGEAWQPLGEGLEGSEITALAVFDDGAGARLAVAVREDGTPDAPSSRIEAWDGVQWQTLAGHVSGSVGAMLEWDDGLGPVLFVGGFFEDIDGHSVRALAYLRSGEWHRLGLGFTPPIDSYARVFTLIAFDDGEGESLYVGGSFHEAGGTDAKHIAKWTGSEWRTVGNWTNPPLAFATHDDGTGEKLYIGAMSQSGLLVWDGAVASPIGGSELGSNIRAFCSSNLTGSRQIILVQRHLYYWDGEVLDRGFPRIAGNSAVWDLLTGDEGGRKVLYAAGEIGWRGYQPCRVARWDAGEWTCLPALGTQKGIPGKRALAFVPNQVGGTLYVTGGFPSDSPVIGHIASWDGYQWQSLGSGLADPYATYGTSLAVYDSGTGHDLYVSGRFTSAGGVPANGIARWDGQQWHALAPGMGGQATAMVVADTGNGPMLYMIGSFTYSGYFFAWDGSAWHTFQGGLNAEPTGIAVMQENGKDVIYLIGKFTSAGGLPSNGFAKWDGEHWHSAWSRPDDGSIRLRALNTPGGERLFALSSKAIGGGQVLGRAYRLEVNSWIPLGEFDRNVHAAATFDDGSGPALFVGGTYDHVGDDWARGIARRNLCDLAQLQGDINGDGVVDHTDLAILLSAFGTCQGDDLYNPAADLTDDGCVDQADLGVLLQVYGR